MKTARELFEDARTAFSGVSERVFQNKQGLISNAILAVRSEVTITETKRTMPLKPLVGVDDLLYTLPSDLDTLIEVKSVKGYNHPFHPYQRTTGQAVDRGETFTTNSLVREYVMGVPVLRLKTGLGVNKEMLTHTDQLLNQATGETVTGSFDTTDVDVTSAWSVVARDCIDFAFQSVSTKAGVVFANLEAKDLAAYGNDGVVTVNLFIPEELVNKLPRVTLRFFDSGNDSFDLEARGTAYSGSLVEGYNQLAFPLKEVVGSSGTPDASAITKIELILEHTVPSNEVIEGVKVSGIAIYRGFGMEIEYYSKYNFVNGTGQYLERPASSALSEMCIFNTDTYRLVLHELRKAMDEARAGDQSGLTWRNAQRALYGLQGVSQEEGQYQRYKRRYPSEVKPQISRWA